MDQLNLPEEMKVTPKLSLSTRPLEYFDRQDAMDNFFEGRGFNSVTKMYYAEEKFDKDVCCGGFMWMTLVGHGTI
jgi:hypothetical protein